MEGALWGVLNREAPPNPLTDEEMEEKLDIDTATNRGGNQEGGADSQEWEGTRNQTDNSRNVEGWHRKHLRGTQAPLCPDLAQSDSARAVEQVNNDCAVALGWKLEGKRNRGRPKTTWCRTVDKERDRQRWNTWTRARQAANNRQQWREDVRALCASWREEI